MAEATNGVDEVDSGRREVAEVAEGGTGGGNGRRRGMQRQQAAGLARH